MYKIYSCPCCDSTDITISPSKLSNFVYWRTSKEYCSRNVSINSLYCNACKFFTTEERFTAEEEQSLYSGYRGSYYNAQRVLCEPEYSSRLLGFDNETYINARGYGISKLIANNVNLETIKTVLDYGGDTGSFIPKEFKLAEKVVYDISGVDVIPGVSKFDPDKHALFDFVMCCHVLEHKSDIDALLADIKMFLYKDSLLYIEVPNCEQLNISSEFRFHEHINMFNKTSLTALLNRNGFSVIDYDTTNFLCILAKLENYENCFNNRSN